MSFNPSTLGKHTYNAFEFKGSKQKSFLAPRGVYISGTKLFVSDTGQNRVFIWNQIPTSEYQEPDVILGQSEIENSGRNSGHEVSASTFQYPSGIWSDGVRLIVADAWNHRVLVWHNMPSQNGQKADIVIGQPDFESNEPNVLGIGNDPTSQTLNWPYGIFSDGKCLWIADTGNRRVLFYNEIPTSNYAKADNVIGKSSFNERDYENTDPIWPYSVKVSKNGHLAIADTQFYRVLIWNNKEDAFNKPANIIIGQDDFDDCGQNQFSLSLGPHTLNWCYDACFYKDGILVNDTGNSRILCFDTIPSKNSKVADMVIGRPDFNTSSEYKENLMGTDTAIYWPFSIITQEDKLIIADTGNHRLIITDLNL